MQASLLPARPLNDVSKRTAAELAKSYEDGTVWGGGASLVRDGVPAWVMSRDERDSKVTVEAVTKGLRDGSSVVLNDAQDRVPEYGAMLDEAKGELGLAGSINVYITPANTTGFSPHFDFEERLPPHPQIYLFPVLFPSASLSLSTLPPLVLFD